MAEPVVAAVPAAAAGWLYDCNGRHNMDAMNTAAANSDPDDTVIFEPDPDAEAAVVGDRSLPLEASAADVLDQRADVPLDDDDRTMD